MPSPLIDACGREAVHMHAPTPGMIHACMNMTAGTRVKNAQFVEQVASLFTKDDNVVVVRPFLLSYFHTILNY